MSKPYLENQEESVGFSIENSCELKDLGGNTSTTFGLNLLAETNTITKGVAASATSSKSFRQEQFDKFLVQAIDEALVSLGEPVKNTFYQHLTDDFGITKDDIPNKLGEFCNIIHKIFGLGASRLEMKFMRNLSSLAKTSDNWPEYEWPLAKWIVMEVSFEEFIHKVRSGYEAEGISKNKQNFSAQK